MKTAIALRHINFEDIGTLNAVLLDQGYQLQYLDPTIENFDNTMAQETDLLIVLGGPIGAYDEQIYPFIEKELSIIRQRLDDRKPLLGICLGAQLIARALDAKVYPLSSKEIGFSSLKLTAAGRESVLAALGDTPVLHWHGDQFDIPVDATHLASTTACPSQAFSIGRNVLGLQFHLEVDVQRIEQWLVGHANELNQTGIDPRKLRTDALELEERLKIAARNVVANWLVQLEKNPSPCQI